MYRLALFLLLASAANAQNSGLTQPDGSPVPEAPRSAEPVYDEIDPAELDRVTHEARRIVEEVGTDDLPTLDDSDPEMKKLVEDFFVVTKSACANVPGGICPVSEALLIGGGAPLAEYLARQIETNPSEADQSTFLYLIGRTRSPAAFAFLSRRARALAAELGVARAEQREAIRAAREGAVSAEELNAIHDATGERRERLLRTLEAIGDLNSNAAAAEAEAIVRPFCPDEDDCDDALDARAQRARRHATPEPPPADSEAIYYEPPAPPEILSVE